MSSVNDNVSSSIYMTSFVQFFLIIFLFISLLFNAGEMVFFTVTLTVTALVSFIWSLFSLYRIDIRVRSETKALFCGESLKIFLDAENRKILPVLLKTGLFMENLVVKGGGIRKTADEEVLFWFQKHTFIFDFTPAGRGVYRINSPEIRGGDLPGFSFKKKNIPGEAEIVVYPRIPEITNLSVIMRDYTGTKKGLGSVPEHLLINGTREYHDGGNMRDIHWKSSAKHSVLMEKVFDSAKKEKVLVLLDVNNFKDKNNAFENTVEAAAASVIKLNRLGISVGFITNGKIYGDSIRHIPVSGNRNEIMLILETLARLEAGDSFDMNDLLKKGRFLPGGVTCLYFASFQSPEIYNVRMLMKRRGIPSKYILSENKDAGKMGSDLIYINDFLHKEMAET